MFQCRMCTSSPLLDLLGLGQPQSQETKTRKRRSDTPFIPRGENEVQGQVKTWQAYVHPRARDFFSNNAELEKVLTQIAKSVNKNSDPVLGSEMECVFWYGST